MTDASASAYVHANAAFDDELGRLHLLEARYDPGTILSRGPLPLDHWRGQPGT